jgi:hypothetical protein
LEEKIIVARFGTVMNPARSINGQAAKVGSDSGLLDFRIVLLKPSQNLLSSEVSALSQRLSLIKPEARRRRRNERMDELFEEFLRRFRINAGHCYSSAMLGTGSPVIHNTLRPNS